MKLYAFSFKSEAIWSMVFTLASLVVGLLVMLVVLIFRWLN